MNTITCPRCDRSLNAAALNEGWCMRCGTKLPTMETPPAPEPPPSPTPRGWSRGQSVLIYVSFAAMTAMFFIVAEKMLPWPWVLAPIAIYVAMAIASEVELRWRRQELREFNRQLERLKNSSQGLT